MKKGREIEIQSTGVWRTKKEEKKEDERLEGKEGTKGEEKASEVVSHKTIKEGKIEETGEGPAISEGEEFDRDYFEVGNKSNYHGYPDDNILKNLKEKADLIVKFFSSRAVLLEVGCAKGYLVKILRERGLKVFGVDISGYAIQEAEDTVEGFVQIADIRGKLPYRDNEFDGVISVDVLEHIEEEKVSQVLGEFKRVGKKQMHFVTFGSGISPNEKDKTHKTMKGQDWWGKKFEEAGFSPENFTVPPL